MTPPPVSSRLSPTYVSLLGTCISFPTYLMMVLTESETLLNELRSAATAANRCAWATRSVWGKSLYCFHRESMSLLMGCPY